MKKPQSVKTKLRVRLEVLKCSDCGRLVFAVGEKVEGCSLRISPHKCSGAWQTLHSEIVALEPINDGGFE